MRLAQRARAGGVFNRRIRLERFVAAHEDALLEEARSRGHLPSDLADLHALALLQHHGAATRLVDATTNLIIAAWFAASGHENEDGVIFLLPRGKELSGTRALSRPMKKVRSTRQLQSYRPPLSMLRAVAQHAVMLVGPVADEPDCCLPHKLHSDQLIRVTPTLKESLVSAFTAHLGTDLAAIFPDLQGFCAQHSTSRSFLEGIVGRTAVSNLARRS